MSESVAYPVFRARHVWGDLFKPVTETERNGKKTILEPNEYYINAGFAVPKAEWDQLWQTMWSAVANDAKGAGQLQAKNAGDIATTQFKWKVIDGDTPDPDGNPRGDHLKGHYIIRMTYSCGRFGRPLPVVDGAYVPLSAESGAKCGDYYNVDATTAFNGLLDHNAGVYQNLNSCMWAAAGEACGGTGPDLRSRFANVAGGSPVAGPAGVTAAPAPTAPVQSAPAPTAPVQSAPAPVQSAPAPVQTTVQPHTDILNPPAAPSPEVEEKFIVKGNAYTRAQLHASKWTDDKIDALPRA